MAGDYAVLASVYNTLGMADFAQRMTPRLLQFAQQNDWLGRRIIDLGCGTGTSTAWFAAQGYNATGLDHSPEMLAQAASALKTRSLNARLVESELRTFELDETYDMALALDVLNDLDSLRDLETVFQRVQSVITKDRLFIFDLHTTEGLASRGLAGDEMIHDSSNMVTFARTVYDFERQLFRANYDIFQQESPSGWARLRAQRQMRAFPVQAVASLLRRQNYDIVAVVNERLEVFDLGTSAAQRVVFVARKQS